MSTIYLAARYSRQQELRHYADTLREYGHEVKARWLYGDYPTDERGLSLEATLPERARLAQQDMNDVIAADWCISFTEQPLSGGRGGRHVEHGIALALNRRCFVIGPREHVFHCLAQVDVFDSWADFVEVVLVGAPR